MSTTIPPAFSGLTTEEVEASWKQHGYNSIDAPARSTWYHLLLDILKEPMLLILVAVAIIYLLVGDYGEAFFMIGAIIVVSGISFYQDTRSRKALEALEKLNEPLSRVIRNGKPETIPSHEIAVGDLCVVEEGQVINADGIILYSSDFSVNESSLTGESFSVYKSKESEENSVYSGTLVVSGMALFKVSAIGTATRLGKIGHSVQTIRQEASPLEKQIIRFVRNMAIIGVIIFLMVCIYRYIQTGSIIDSLLAGLTMAMSVLPEEIPVAFTTFMALGAWKLMREGIIIKRSSVVETLGSTTVICTDKTGTITQNVMELAQLYYHPTNKIYKEKELHDPQLEELIGYAMWASEPVPFDPMEKSIHQLYTETQENDQRASFKLVREYPLEGRPPMMTHIFESADGQHIVAAKGAPEAIIAASQLSAEEKEKLRKHVHELGRQGYRVLGVARSDQELASLPEKQQDISFEFLGLTVFYDPPKQNIAQVFQTIYRAGIQVKVITGDNTDTTRAIARQAGINTSVAITGEEVMACETTELQNITGSTTLFTRMFPEAKLAVVNSLKAKGEVVAMLGDGVNDAPALKAAHIGVAMGNKGTEIAKAAAALIITNDDLGKLITAISAGRRIYSNIKKAIQYIISIHIPIILTVSLPLFLGWIYPQIFTPVHVIFLELVMGPTCSIVYENEPMERNTMLQKPRALQDTFLNWRELSISIIQGLMITAAVLFVYQFTVRQGGDEIQTRSVVFTTLIFANVFLCLSNRSFYYSIFESLTHTNLLFPLIISATLLILLAILYVPVIAGFFEVRALSLQALGLALSAAAVSVLWVELYKWAKRRRNKTTDLM